MINGHGNNIYQFEEAMIEYDFSSNIAYNNLSRPILEHLKESMEVVCNYPDPEAKKLTEMISKHLSCDSGQILVTNGSAEAFYLLAQYFASIGSKRAAIVTPSFAEYEDSCKAHGHQIDYITFEDLASIDLAQYNTLWIGVPNNPDGTKIDCAEISQIANRHPNCTIIIDRAYNELSATREEKWELPFNTIIVDSFTKLYGIPGIRLGYIVAPQQIIESLSAIRPPWSVNSLSIVAGEYIMQHLDELHPNIEELIAESKYLQSQIALIDGFRVTPSDCNFFLVEILSGRNDSNSQMTSELQSTSKPQMTSELQQYLIEEHKILIRDCSNFRALTPNYFRVAAQERRACDKLIKALKEWR